MSAGLLRRIFGVRPEGRAEQGSAGGQMAVQGRAKGRAKGGCGI